MDFNKVLIGGLCAVLLIALIWVALSMRHVLKKRPEVVENEDPEKMEPDQQKKWRNSTDDLGESAFVSEAAETDGSTIDSPTGSKRKSTLSSTEKGEKILMGSPPHMLISEPEKPEKESRTHHDAEGDSAHHHATSEENPGEKQQSLQATETEKLAEGDQAYRPILSRSKRKWRCRKKGLNNLTQVGRTFKDHRDSTRLSLFLKRTCSGPLDSQVTLDRKRRERNMED